MAELEHLIARPWLGLRFEAVLEAAYEAATIDGRSRSVRLAMVVGLLLLALGLAKDVRSFASLAEPTIAVRVFMVGPLHLLALVAASKRYPIWMQGAATIMAVLSAVRMVPLLGMASSANSAEGYLIAAGAVSAIVNLVVPLRFRHAIIYAGLAIATLYAMAFVGPATHRFADENGLLHVMTIAMVLSLGFNLRLETGSRRAFLMTLRDQRQTRQLLELNEQLRRLSDTDQLTGLPNRRSFGSALERAWDSATINSELIGLMMIDIDHFKRINDQFGHADGDTCLRAVGDALRGGLADQIGMIARYGGEEFVAILPGVAEPECMRLAERLRVAVERRRFAVADDARPIGVTISIGVATIRPTPAIDARVLLVAADEALYRAKQAGRNIVMSQGADRGEARSAA